MTGSKRLVLWLAFILSLSVAEPASATSDESREVPVTYRGEGVGLAASLLLPEGAGPFSAGVIVQGSGESDRTNEWARAVADTLVEAGMAVLLTDKRGSGLSSGDWRRAGFDDLAGDALAGVRFLASRPEIDAGRVGLVGLSQGGRVVPLAASLSADVAFVINLVGDAVSFAEQSAHEMSNVARQAGLSEAHRLEVLALNSAAGQAMLNGDWSEYARLLDSGLESPWSPVAQGFPPVGDPIWTFYGKVLAFDPMPYWILLRQPVLILYGEEDESDNVAVAESVRRLNFGFAQTGKTDADVIVLPGVGHALGWRSDTGLGAAAKDVITAWYRANVANGRGAPTERN